MLVSGWQNKLEAAAAGDPLECNEPISCPDDIEPSCLEVECVAENVSFSKGHKSSLEHYK